jgi:hypothetical protein
MQTAPRRPHADTRTRRIGILTFAVVIAATLPAPTLANETRAVPVGDFLSSIGVVSTFPDRGQPLHKTVEMLRYGGFRWVRAGIEGLTAEGPTNLQTFIELNRQTGVKLSWGLGSGGNDLTKLIATGKVIAQSGALLAFEGNNEPNNWAVTYDGVKGGGRKHSWLAVGRLQNDLYRSVKNDPQLMTYPVWSISESGAQTDNVGLQFLRIPEGAGTLMPAATAFADFANVHNYIYHPNAPDPADNKSWDAADPTKASRVDGLYGNYGRTWSRGYAGHDERELADLPRVTTETGLTVGGAVTERMHGTALVNMYLAQFKRGYAYTAVYILRDRTDEDGNQKFGFFRPDYAPRLAAHFLHNLTTVLADAGTGKAGATTERLAYSIPDRPATVHDLLLQHSDGTFHLIVWGERQSGEDNVTLQFASAMPSVEIYDATVGTKPVHKVTRISSLPLVLSDHPLVLKLPPPLVR